MCNVGGFLFTQRPPHPSLILDFLPRLLMAGEDRGVDATGVVFVDQLGAMQWIRKALPAHEFVRDPEVMQVFQKWCLEATAVLWNSRAQPLPEGDSLSEQNRQPIVVDHIAITHNGTISNDRELTQGYNLPRSTEVDTEVAARLYS